MATKASARMASGGGEGQGDPEGPVQPLADQAAAAEGQQQGHPADHRRQHHRQGGQGLDQVAAGEGDRFQQDGQRTPSTTDTASAPSEQTSDSRSASSTRGWSARPRCSPTGSASRPTSGRVRNATASAAGTSQARRPAPCRHVVGGGRNPYSLRTCWPSAERTRSTNACAASGLGWA